MDEIFEAAADSFNRASCGGRCAIISACLAVVGLIVYIAVALEGVEPLEYAIIRNNINQSID